MVAPAKVFALEELRRNFNKAKKVPDKEFVLCQGRISFIRDPFDNLFLTRLSFSRALCTGITAVISASTVSVSFRILAYNYLLVKNIYSFLHFYAGRFLCLSGILLFGVLGGSCL